MKVFALSDFTIGRLAIATRPRGGDWLETDLLNLKRSGWDVLVSALERDEEQALELSHEAPTAGSLGLKFIGFPIPDRSIPEMERTIRLIIALQTSLESGDSVAIHCRMGIGRSSMLCGALLVACGASPEAAWSQLTSARQLAVPDTDEQRQWLKAFQLTWGSRS